MSNYYTQKKYFQVNFVQNTLKVALQYLFCIYILSITFFSLNFNSIQKRDQKIVLSKT